MKKSELLRKAKTFLASKKSDIDEELHPQYICLCLLEAVASIGDQDTCYFLQDWIESLISPCCSFETWINSTSVQRPSSTGTSSRVEYF